MAHAQIEVADVSGGHGPQDRQEEDGQQGDHGGRDHVEEEKRVEEHDLVETSRHLRWRNAQASDHWTPLLFTQTLQSNVNKRGRRQLGDYLGKREKKRRQNDREADGQETSPVFGDNSIRRRLRMTGDWGVHGECGGVFFVFLSPYGTYSRGNLAKDRDKTKSDDCDGEGDHQTCGTRPPRSQAKETVCVRAASRRQLR